MNRTDPSRVLVTGGAGFLGSHLCEQLLEQGHEVLSVDNYYTGSKMTIEHLLNNSRFEMLRHDVTFPLYVEVDENRLLSYGDSIKTLLPPFIQMSYSMYTLNKKGISEPLTYNDVKRKIESFGYTDLLLLHNMNKYKRHL